MLDKALVDLSAQAHRRTKFLMHQHDRMYAGDTNLKADCLAECWLALESGKQAVEVVKAASNVIRLQERPVRQSSSVTYHAPLEAVERQLDATTYMGVLRQALRPDEFELLQARELLDLSFEELAVRSLRAKGVEPTESAQSRESARLRKQLHRLRLRCATLLTASYPNAAEDIGCWS